MNTAGAFACGYESFLLALITVRSHRRQLKIMCKLRLFSLFFPNISCQLHKLHDWSVSPCLLWAAWQKSYLLTVWTVCFSTLLCVSCFAAVLQYIGPSSWCQTFTRHLFLISAAQKRKKYTCSPALTVNLLLRLVRWMMAIGNCLGGFPFDTNWWFFFFIILFLWTVHAFSLFLY